MAGGKLRRVREVAEMAFRRVMAARQWARLSAEERMRFEMMRRFLGVDAEELRVRFAAKAPAEMMQEMHEAVARMHPKIFAQKIHNWAMAAEEARMSPERTVNFFLTLRDILHEAGAEEQLHALQQVHEAWAERQQERNKGMYRRPAFA